MYPLPAQLPHRLSDFSIEIRGDKARSSRFTTKEKGKTKVLSVVRLEKSGSKDPVVMPIGKRSTEEKEEVQQVQVRRREKCTKVRMQR